jgi:hypothetical protein
LNFLFAEKSGKLANLFAGQVEIGGGVGRDGSGAAKPSEETANAAKPGKLGIGDERLAAARAAVLVEERSFGDRCLDGTEK